MTELREVFHKRFGRPPSLGARAPGRVNLIGEHTDYNDGLALPCAVDRDTLVMAAPRDDASVRVYSCNQNEEHSFSVAAVADERPGATPDWSDYVKGVVFAFCERIEPVRGLDLVVASRVPVGAGLSSSAAFTVSVATAISLAEGWDLSARDIAEVAHRAESEYVGVGCGILDPFASALGLRDRALFLDCRSRSTREVWMPPGEIALLIADSGVRRALADGDSGYRQRVRECHAAARAASVASLRDVPFADLSRLQSLLDDTLWRRMRHVVSENARVHACADALEASDLVEVGALLSAGHESLRDDFDGSIPELDALCEIADALPGVYGSRLTGAGFGGCTLHLVEPSRATQVAGSLTDAFQRRFGRPAPTVVVQTADGAGALALD